MDVEATRAQQQSLYNSAISASQKDDTSHEIAALRVKAVRLLHSKLLDYKHNSPANLKKCIELLIRLSENIVQNPDEQKYRKVRATNAAFRSIIAPYPAALELISLMGWHAVVEDLEKTWVYEHSPGTLKFMAMQECLPELQKALTEIETKQQHVGDTSAKKKQQQEQREAILRAIDEDFQDRKQTQQLKLQAAAAEPEAQQAAPNATSSTVSQLHTPAVAQQQAGKQGSTRRYEEMDPEFEEDD